MNVFPYPNILRAARQSAALSNGAKVLLHELAILCERDGFSTARDSHLARECGTSERNIRRQINALEDAGFIAREGSTKARRIWILSTPATSATTDETGRSDSGHFGQTEGSTTAKSGAALQRDKYSPSGSVRAREQAGAPEHGRQR